MKIYKIVFLVFISLMFLTTACEFGKEEKKEEPKEIKKTIIPKKVNALSVTKGTLPYSIQVSATASGIREGFIVAETQGKIVQRNFNLGDKVSKGKLLVSVDNTLQKASLAQAKKSYESATLNLTVTKTLHTQKNASKAEMNAAESAETSAKAGLEAAQKAYNDTRVYAPFSGFIAQRDPSIEVGNLLAGGTLITRIVDLSKLRATLYVSEMDISKITPSMDVSIYVAALQKTFTGKVVATGAGSDPATGSYPIEIQWNNTKDFAIKSGMSIRVKISTAEQKEVIVIPLNTIIEKSKKSAVYVSTKNKCTLRYIATGEAYNNHTTITSGLSVGDKIISTGLDNINPGDSLIVTITGESGAL